MVWMDKDGTVCLFRRWSFPQGSCAAVIQSVESLPSSAQIKTQAEAPRDGSHTRPGGIHSTALQRDAGLSLTYTSCSITIRPVKRKNMGLNYSQMDALTGPPRQQQRDTKRAAPEPEARRPETSEE
ncbi:hypothetical protein Q8A67_021874 [Cirrhinus molitorella]|uniref:Uncharacterized protein n=1 Tax=Cirrhinus molitorella TaxID=172907 RepID=A0AA88TEV0_9TELE|nr:hypothetical protein Q8A67_021874 [Cirrhinus molitorella]